MILGKNWRGHNKIREEFKRLRSSYSTGISSKFMDMSVNFTSEPNKNGTPIREQGQSRVFNETFTELHDSPNVRPYFISNQVENVHFNDILDHHNTSLSTPRRMRRLPTFGEGISLDDHPIHYTPHRISLPSTPGRSLEEEKNDGFNYLAREQSPTGPYNFPTSWL